MAYNSVGYYHPDEHFQILEFASYKMGNIRYEHLPWEYHYEIRPTLQPFIALLFIKAFTVAGLNNPYTIAFVLRMLTGILAIYSICRFVSVFYSDVSDAYKGLFLFMSFFLWMLPFVNVRFSSETLSGIFFLLAVSFLLRRGRWSAYIVGVCIGLSFLCRYQAALMIVGMLLWLIIIRREHGKYLWKVLVTCILVVLIGMLLDSVYYGSFSISAWNYFRENILHDKASGFGVVTWYQYLLNVLKALYFPTGVLVLLSLIIFIIKYPASVVTWCMVPFILVHFMIPHKEIRFMFPLVNFIPLILVKGFFEYVTGESRIVRRGIIFLVVGFNTIFLFVLLYSAPENGRMLVTKYIYDHYQNKPMRLYYPRKDNPFKPYSFLRQSFYEMPNVTCLPVNTRLQVDALPDAGGVDLLVLRQEDVARNDIPELLREQHGILLLTGRPPWIRKLLRLIAYDDNGNEYVLFRIR